MIKSAAAEAWKHNFVNGVLSSHREKRNKSWTRPYSHITANNKLYAHDYVPAPNKRDRFPTLYIDKRVELSRGVSI